MYVLLKCKVIKLKCVLLKYILVSFRFQHHRLSGLQSDGAVNVSIFQQNCEIQETHLSPCSHIEFTHKFIYSFNIYPMPTLLTERPPNPIALTVNCEENRVTKQSLDIFIHSPIHSLTQTINTS